jgi:hypothetical protein
MLRRREHRWVVKGDVSRRVIGFRHLSDERALSCLTGSVEEDDRSILQSFEELSSDRSLVHAHSLVLKWMKINH